MSDKRPPGRPKGARNKRSEVVEAAVAKGGITPLEFMLRILRDEEATKDDRKWAADKAAPYIHPRLASTEVKVPEKIVHEIKVKVV